MLLPPPTAPLSCVRPLLCALGLLVAGAGSLPAGSAEAGEKPTIAVIGVHGDGREDAEALQRLSDDLIEGFIVSRLEPIHGEDLAVRIERSREVLPERVFLEPVRRAVDEGRQLYRQAQPERAATILQTAINTLEARRALLRSPQLAVDLFLNLGLAQLNLGQRSQAERSFEEVVRIDPNRILDDLNYSPKIVEAFDSVRRRVLGERSASIYIALPGEDPGARVYIDGRLIGTTPITASRLPSGKHLVVVDGGELGLSSSEVILSAGQQLDLPVDLKPATLALPEERFEPGRSMLVNSLYREIGLASGVDLVAVAAFGPKGDFHIALYSPRADAFSVEVVASLSAAPGERSAFVRQLVDRVSRYADENGNIRAERMAVGGISMRVSDNPVLDGLLWPRPVEETIAVTPQTDDPLVRKKLPPPNPKVIGVVAAIVGGSLGAVGIGFGINEALRNSGDREPVGLLVITVP